MSEPNATPTPGPAHGPRPAGPSAPEQEAALDEALDRALDRESGAEARPEVPLKRQWDDALEAELEAALAGFDPKTFDVARPRPANRSGRA